MAKRVEVDKGERVDHWVEPVKKDRQGKEKRNMGKEERLIAHGLCHREDRRDCYRKEDFSVGGACDEVGSFGGGGAVRWKTWKACLQRRLTTRQSTKHCRRGGGVDKA